MQTHHHLSILTGVVYHVADLIAVLGRGGRSPLYSDTILRSTLTLHPRRIADGRIEKSCKWEMIEIREPFNEDEVVKWICQTLNLDV